MKFTYLLISLIFSSTVFGQATQFTNVNGYTLDNDGDLQQFSNIVFEKGKILAIGNSSLLEQYPKAKTIDGQGKTMLPGLIDAHGHLLGLGETLLEVDVRESKSAQDAALMVKDYARKHAELDWLTGRGWNQVLWPDKQFPVAQQIDEYINDRPVWLTRVDGHAGWANTKALTIAGISRDTLDPPGGKILRDAKGNPSGVLIDNAMLLLQQHLPQATDEVYSQQLSAVGSHLLSLGITSMHDAGVDHSVYQFYQKMQAMHDLPIRIYAMIAATDPALKSMLKKGPIKSDDDFLSIGSVKAYGDGALGSRGAALLAAYSDAPENSGLLLTAEKDLQPLFDLVLGNGFQLNYHAIGDRANRLALDQFEQSFSRIGGQQLRNRIEHAQVISLQDIPRFKQLDIIPSMQPTHATSDMNMAQDRIGKQRLKGAYAWQRFLQQGSHLAFGSDFPVELANPFYGLHAAVTRQNRNNQPPEGWIKEQSLNIKQAFRAFTLDAAYAAHQEEVLGGLTAGKWADFILVDQDIFSIAPSKLWKTSVLQTWIGGELRYNTEK